MARIILIKKRFDFGYGIDGMEPDFVQNYSEVPPADVRRM